MSIATSTAASDRYWPMAKNDLSSVKRVAKREPHSPSPIQLKSTRSKQSKSLRVDDHNIPYGFRMLGIKASCAVYPGRMARHRQSTRGANQLLIGNTVFVTLVDGISEIQSDKYFRGIIKLKETINGEYHYLLFAHWFSPARQSSFLTSLGEYSESSYASDLACFCKNPIRSRHLCVTLSPIKRKSLENIDQKFLQTNIENAYVCLLKETISQTDG